MITIIKQLLSLSNEWKKLITNREASSYLRISFNLTSADLHEVLDIIISNMNIEKKGIDHESDD